RRARVRRARPSSKNGRSLIFIVTLISRHLIHTRRTEASAGGVRRGLDWSRTGLDDARGLSMSSRKLLLISSVFAYVLGNSVLACAQTSGLSTSPSIVPAGTWPGANQP